MGSSEVGHNAPNQWRLGRSDAGAPDAVGGTPTSEISKKWFLFSRVYDVCCMDTLYNIIYIQINKYIYMCVY